MLKDFVAPTKVSLGAVASLKDSFVPDESLFVVNLLECRERAGCPDEAPLAGLGGREAYLPRYLPAFGSVNAGKDTSPIWDGNAVGLLVGEEGKEWDDVAAVQYPLFSVFVEATTGQARIDHAGPRRLAALEDLRLVATKTAQLPG